MFKDKLLLKKRMTKSYVLEVVRFVTQKVDGENTKLKHVGYMNVKFKTKKEACDYYGRCNPHLRPLNAYKDYKSDWDPKTELLYIVREYYGLFASIPPFTSLELPFNGSEYLYL
jgi:hypothetical protein